MSVDDLSPEEIDRRFNHWQDNDVHRCKNCSGFVSPQEPDNGRIEYVCPKCDRAILEWVG